jgi:hypothetical protein
MKFNWGRENWINRKFEKKIKNRCSKLLSYYGNVHLVQHKYYQIKKHVHICSDMCTHTDTHTHKYTPEIQ